MIFLSPGNVEETETVQQIENATGKTYLKLQLGFLFHIFEQPPPGSGARRGDPHVQGQRAGIDSALCERTQDFDIFIFHLQSWPCKSFVKFVNLTKKRKSGMFVLISVIICKCEQRNLEFVNFIFSGKKKNPKMIDVSILC